MNNITELKDKKLLSRKEAAAYIGIGVTSMYHAMKRPDFPPITRIGNLVFVKRELLDEWIDSQTRK